MNIKKIMIQSFLVVILPLVFVNMALAAIYKTVDKGGNVIFTDAPPVDEPSEEVKLQPITPIPPALIRSSGSSIQKEEDEGEGSYSHLEIVEPANDATVREQGNFKVKVVTEPKIFSGHIIRLLLDGDVVGESKRKLSFDLTNVDRGTHTLTVEIVDNRRTVVQSSSNTVYVHRNVYRPAVSTDPPSL